MALNVGDVDRIVGLAREAKAAADASGDLAAGAMAETSAGCAMVLQGDIVEAVRLGESAVAQARAAGNPFWLANVLGDVGAIYSEAGDRTQASALIEEALAIDRSHGDRYLSAVRLSDLGILAHQENDEVTAARCYAEGIGLFWEVGSVWYLASPLAGLAAIASSQDPVAATRLVGAAEVLRERGSQAGWPLERERDEQTIARLRTTLGEEAYARELLTGRSMPLSDAVAIAIALSMDSTQPPVAPAGIVDELSARELEVLRLLVAGHSDKDIAEALSISPRTASKHVGNILAKLGVSTRGEASVYAVRAGLA
jgi:DNA-binding CsgD family transcriptional regulator